MTSFGAGFVLLDICTIGALWMVFLANVVLAFSPAFANAQRGRKLMARRAICVPWGLYAMIFSYRFWEFGWDLPSSPLFNSIMLMHATGGFFVTLNVIKEGPKEGPMS